MRAAGALLAVSALLIGALSAVSLGGASGAGGVAVAGAATVPCGTLSGPPATFKHVIVIMDENQSYSAIIGAPGSTADKTAPAINAYARSCGVATNYHAITHPSHSDYIAATAGNTYVAPGCTDWTCVSQQLNFCDANGNTGGTMTCPNVFSQLDSRAISWKTYAESMPSNCATSAADPYSAGHNPPVWFIQGGGSYNLASSCAAHDVPLASSTAGLQHDIDNNSLPAYSWIVPNKCNDMHNCSGQNPVTAGDTFIKTWVDRIIATPDYQNGSTVIFLTWDEGVEGGRPFNEDCLAQANLSDESCHVATVVLSPYITPGTAPSTFFTHYSLLKTTEKMLGVSQYLGHAADTTTTDMLSAFGLAGSGGGGTPLFTENFESGNLGKWTVKGSVVDQQAVVLNGSWAANATTTGTPSNASAPLSTTASSATVDVHLRVASHGATATGLFRIQTAASKNLATLSINASNRLVIRNNVAGTTATSTTALSLNAWHDVSVTLTTGASGTTTVKLDGVNVPALAQTWNLGTTPVGRLQIGDSTKSRTSSVYFDDISVS